MLEFREIPKPVQQAGELLVKVHATTVGRTDSCALRAHPFFVRTYAGLLRPHLELARRLGADRVIDYTAEDFTKIGETFDFVLDAVGKTSYFRCRPLLKPEGVFSATDLGPWWQNVALALWSSLTGTGRVVLPTPRSDQTFIEFLKARIQTGEFHAVIDRQYPLTDIADAYRYVDTECKAGIVVIEIVPETVAPKA